MAATSGLNMTHSQTPENLFPLCKLKGNFIFATSAVAIGKDEAEKDPGQKPEGEGETEPSADEDVEVLGKIGRNGPIHQVYCLLQESS